MRRLAWALCVAGCGAASSVPPRPPKTVELVRADAPNAAVDANAALVDGYVTVVDFWSESCGACVIVGAMLAVQIADAPRILVRKINVGDGDTAAAHAYQIGALPHFNVYDTHRRLRYVLVGNDCLSAPRVARELLAEP